MHNLDEAWTYTTGSSNVKIGVYSMLGFIQNHQDLSGSRVLTSQGHAVEPALDYASEMVGITGADTDNGIGMAGIDRAANFQSYSLLRSGSNPDADGEETFDLPDGGTATFHFFLDDYADLLDAGRSAGVDVHLFSYGIPTTNPFGDGFDGVSTDPDPVDFSTSSGGGGGLGDVIDRFGDFFLDFFSLFFSGPFDLSSNTNPLVVFNDAIGNAVFDGGVVVAANGDQRDNAAAAYLPAGKDRYVLSVGGVEYNDQSRLVAWEGSRATLYVDVAGFADGVVGFSGAGPTEYDEDFGGTAAAASIGAGVASLVKGEYPSLSGEDIDKVLEITARDADQPGRDNLTGAGAIDAGAAFQFLQNNDIQREKVAVANIISDQEVTGDVVALNGLGYEDHYLPSGTCLSPYPVYANGKLHQFEARVEFTNTFSDPPEAWVRWARSDGLVSENRYDQEHGGFDTYYNPFRKKLKVVSVDERGLVVEGRYWGDVSWHTTFGETCANERTIPNAAPGSFLRDFLSKRQSGGCAAVL